MIAMPAIQLNLRDVSVDYRRVGQSTLRAVSNVSLDVPVGSTLALIGESGSGKSTLARAVCGLVPHSTGSIAIGDTVLGADSAAARTAGAAGVQLVAQDSTAALDPRWPVWKIISEPARLRDRLSGAKLRSLAEELLEKVGLPRNYAEHRPRQLSGGQRQRINIARALAASATVLVLDEAVSALDISVRNEILYLLAQLKGELGLTYVFITHDIGPVIQFADLVAVLYLGGVVESGAVSEVVHNPQHPYTRALIDAVPVIGRRAAQRLDIGEIDDPANRPSGCWFQRRCPYATEICRSEIPRQHSHTNRMVACHHAGKFESSTAKGGMQ